MRRGEGERGAVAVWVAFAILPLIVFVAVVADVGLLYWEKGQLQNGADAAALAVAQECATDPTNCTGVANGIATGMSGDNANDTQANAAILNLQVNASSGSVTVESSTLNDEGVTVRHPFASLFVPSETTVTAEATAEWGAPIAGSTFPLTIADCEFDDMPAQPADTVNPDVVELLINNGTSNTNGNQVPVNQCDNGYPGGFGWLDSEDCVATIQAGGVVDGITGIQPNVNKTGCTNDDWLAILCKTHLIPLYTSTTDQGAGGTYTISRFAAFVVTAYKTSGGPATYCGNYSNLPAFSQQNAKGIQGFFVEYVELGEEFELGPAPDAGLMIVRLSG
ncbi:pilus assembly protein TadG-related protein [Agromyces arachidis]|uniref:pilus assembly protein TadG-related protein n=1 Tax=Agromyces arachidis TaxID=766966 RepID=UPI0040562F4D